MAWKIVAMQKDLVGVAAHNYLALLNDEGQIIREFHGLFSNSFTMFGTIRIRETT